MHSGGVPHLRSKASFAVGRDGVSPSRRVDKARSLRCLLCPIADWFPSSNSDTGKPPRASQSKRSVFNGQPMAADVQYEKHDSTHHFVSYRPSVR